MIEKCVECLISLLLFDSGNDQLETSQCGQDVPGFSILVELADATMMTTVSRAVAGEALVALTFSLISTVTDSLLHLLFVQGDSAK